jgi:hypothetical protein
VVVFVILFAVLGTAVMFAALAMPGPSRSAPEVRAVLVFKVPYRLEEGQAPSGGMFDLRAAGAPPRSGRSLKGIRHAASDPHFVALIMHVDGIEWGWGKLLRDSRCRRRLPPLGENPLYAALSGGDEAG